MTDQVKKNKNIKEDEERLKGQEKKENRKYLHFIFNLFTIDLRPYLSVLKLFTFSPYVDDDLVVWLSGNLEG